MELSSSRPSANQCLAFLGSVDLSLDALRFVDIAKSAAKVLCWRVAALCSLLSFFVEVVLS